MPDPWRERGWRGSPWDGGRLGGLPLGWELCGCSSCFFLAEEAMRPRVEDSFFVEIQKKEFLFDLCRPSAGPIPI